jgi:hypothetical protein
VNFCELDDYLTHKYKSWYSFIFKKYMLINGNENFLKIHDDFLKIKKNIHWWRFKFREFYDKINIKKK